MKHTRYAWLAVSALLVAAVIAGGMTFSAQAGIGSTLAKIVGKVAGTSTKTRCLTGQVVSLSLHKNGKQGALTVSYANPQKKIVHKNFKLTKSQYNAAITRSIKKGSRVKACWKGGTGRTVETAAGNIINLAPRGQENTGYGEENGGGGGGGGGGT